MKRLIPWLLLMLLLAGFVTLVYLSRGVPL
jgi:hypothetical protein